MRRPRRSAPPGGIAAALLLLLLARPASTYTAALWTQRGISEIVFDDSSTAVTPTQLAGANYCEFRGFATDECIAAWICESAGATSILYQLKLDDAGTLAQPISVDTTEESRNSLKYDVDVNAATNELFYSEYITGPPSGFRVKVDMLKTCLLFDEATCTTTKTCEWDAGIMSCKKSIFTTKLAEVPAETDKGGGFVSVGGDIYIAGMANGAAQLYKTAAGSGSNTMSAGVESYWKTDVTADMVLGKPRVGGSSIYLPIMDPVAGKTFIHRIDTGDFDTLVPKVYEFPFTLRPFADTYAAESSMVVPPNFEVLDSGSILYTDGTSIYFNALSSAPTKLYEEMDASLTPIGPLVLPSRPCTPPTDVPLTPAPMTPMPSTLVPGDTLVPPTPEPPTPAPGTVVPGGTAVPPGPTDAPGAVPPSGVTLQPLGSDDDDDDDSSVWIFVVLGVCVVIGAICCFLIYRFTRPVILPTRHRDHGEPGAGAGAGDDGEHELKPKSRPARVKKLPLEAMPTDRVKFSERPDFVDAEKALDLMRKTGSPSGMTVESKVGKEKDRLRGMVADDFTQQAVEDWRGGQDRIHAFESEVAATPYTRTNVFEGQSPTSTQPYVSLVPLPQSIQRREAHPMTNRNL